jgi:hypothetical protein
VQHHHYGARVAADVGEACGTQRLGTNVFRLSANRQGWLVADSLGVSCWDRTLGLHSPGAIHRGEDGLLVKVRADYEAVPNRQVHGMQGQGDVQTGTVVTGDKKTRCSQKKEFP